MHAAFKQRMRNLRAGLGIVLVLTAIAVGLGLYSASAEWASSHQIKVEASVCEPPSSPPPDTPPGG